VAAGEIAEPARCSRAAVEKNTIRPLDNLATRRLMGEETHQEAFTWVPGLLSNNDVPKGKTLGVGATTLEANAALRPIGRRDHLRSYEGVLTAPARSSRIRTPTRKDPERVDRKRKKGRARTD
jgi:transposase